MAGRNKKGKSNTEVKALKTTRIRPRRKNSLTRKKLRREAAVARWNPEAQEQRSARVAVEVDGTVVGITTREFTEAPAPVKALAAQLLDAFGEEREAGRHAITFVRIRAANGVTSSVLFTEHVWKSVRKVVREGVPVTITGYTTERSFPQLDELVGHAGSVKNPTRMVISGYDRRGRPDPMLYLDIQGRRIDERPLMRAGYTTGYCLRCRDTVDRSGVEVGVNAKGRELTKGVCTGCGGDVYRMGGQVATMTPVVSRA